MSVGVIKPDWREDPADSHSEWDDDFLSYADGKKDLIDIAETLDIPAWELFEVIKKLKQNKLIKTISV